MGTDLVRSLPIKLKEDGVGTSVKLLEDFMSKEADRANVGPALAKRCSSICSSGRLDSLSGYCWKALFRLLAVSQSRSSP